MTKKERKQQGRNWFCQQARGKRVVIGGKEYKSNGRTLVRVSYQPNKHDR